ncbi:MAG: response regulator [Angelakisella sp.]
MHTAIVVDDEPITCMDLSEMLREQGFSVIGKASDGFDAIELCRSLNPDVVLMDIRMPIFDGLSAAETIQEEELAGCVVLLTAFSDKELIDRANQIGVTGYLVKPVEERLLLPTIEVALSQSKRLRAMREENRTITRQMEENKLIDRAKAAIARENGISESQAYAQLRQLSMDKRCPISTLAKAVLENNSQREVVRKAKEQLIRSHGVSETAAYKRIQEIADLGGITMLQAARDVLAKQKS